MKRFLLIFFLCFANLVCVAQSSNDKIGDEILEMLVPKAISDVNFQAYKVEAARRYSLFALPSTLNEWEKYKTEIKSKLIKEAAIEFNHKLPFKNVTTHSLELENYSVQNLYFQTLPGVFATANLYKPKGDGPFPAVVVMMGHSTNGKLYDNYQSVGHTLALNGYVAICIDPFGASERGTNPHQFEYHGANRGMSLFNIGKSLLGTQVSENIRAVDFLQSLPYVDKDKIAATGASGGGNQTMWLAALDERIKAAVPVVSVGTFESYIMNSNCVCELLTNGLNFTEEATIIGMVAPRALRICNHRKDSNPSFFPSEMRRTAENAKQIYQLYNAKDKLDQKLYDLTHGYFPENRRTLLGWLDFHLKGLGQGALKAEIPFTTLHASSLKVFKESEKRFIGVKSIAEYAYEEGIKLRKIYLKNRSFQKDFVTEGLKEVLKIKDFNTEGATYDINKFGDWKRVAISTEGHRFFSILIKKSIKPSSKYVVLASPEGVNGISKSLIDGYITQNSHVVLVDFSGTGQTFPEIEKKNKREGFFNRSRSDIWLGQTLIGEFSKELKLVTNYLKTVEKADEICIDAVKEAGIAALGYAAVYKDVELVVRNTPVSYLFDKQGDVNYFTMGVHLPGILNWGDVSLIAALANKNITFVRPVTMGGRAVETNELESIKTEFNRVNSLIGYKKSIVFN